MEESKNMNRAPFRDKVAISNTRTMRPYPHPPQIAIQPPEETKRTSILVPVPPVATTAASQAAEAHPIKRSIGPWQLGVDVGQGGSCLVRVVRHQTTNQKAVAKIVNVATADRVRARSLANLSEIMSKEDPYHQVNLPLGLEREATILRILDHPNVCKLYDVWQHFNEVYLILEYVEGGELFSYITQTNALRGRKEKSLQMDEREAICVFRQILAGILYCHRLQIFHRDLKPENILYNPATKTIKLIDYGMAAFQPQGTKLSTPCGSPHYAAPELLHGKTYDGSKADVWSAGVILYALLLGDLPFNYPSNTPKEDQIHALYAQIKRADYELPEGLAPEIKDLFRKIFQPDPHKRIDMRSLWDHRYLHKYDHQLGWKGLGFDNFVGPMPGLQNWKLLTPATIDTSILRSLSTLWHSTDRATLVQQLCNNVANIEKYFYQALCKSYNDALENLDILFYRNAGTAAGLVSSESDYHHIHLPLAVRDRLDKTFSHQHTNSKFSVYKEEHLTSQHSFFDDDDNEKNAQSPLDNNIKHQIHHNQHLNNHHHHHHHHHHRNGNRLSSNHNRSTSRLSITSNHSRSVISRASSNASFQRRANSSNPLSVIPISSIRKHKHRVSFDHKRRIVIPSQYQHQDIPRADSSCLPNSLNTPPRTTAKSSFLQVPGPSPLPLPGNLINVQKKRTYLSHATPDSHEKMLKTFDVEARKVSHELAQVCQAAFFTSSADESLTTCTEDSSLLNNTNTARHITDTPPSSISNQSAAGKYHQTMLDRPLPPAPALAQIELKPPTTKSVNIDTNSSSLEINHFTRQIADIKHQLSQKFVQTERMGEIQRYMEEIIDKLDVSIPRETWADRLGNKNGHSFLGSSEFLQAIPEESRGQASASGGKTSVSSSILVADTSASAFASAKNFPGTTIRHVDPSSPVTPSPTSIAPLRVRKTSPITPTSSSINALPLGNNTASKDYRHRQAITNGRKYTGEKKLKPRKRFWDRLSQARVSMAKRSSVATSVNVDFTGLDDRVSRRDERFWNESPSALFSNSDTVLASTPTKEGKAILRSKGKGKWKRKNIQSRQSTQMDYTTMDHTGVDGRQSSSTSTRFKIGKLFQKKPKGRFGIDKIRPESAYDDTARGMFSMVATMPPALQNGYQVPLLNRILRLKPASYIMVFKKNRKLVRQLLVSVLRLENSKKNIKELAMHPRNINYMTARIDDENEWGFKPLWFALEFFNILREGQQSNITAFRLTQIRGSASSVQKLGDVFLNKWARNYLLQDPEETKQITRLIQTGSLNSRVDF